MEKLIITVLGFMTFIGLMVMMNKQPIMQTTPAAAACVDMRHYSCSDAKAATGLRAIESMLGSRNH